MNRQARASSRRTRIAVFWPYASKRAADVARRNAGREVQAALFSERLRRSPCERCGRKRTVEAHHDDYSKPLEIRWLCRHHHRLRDAELREERKGLQVVSITDIPPQTRRVKAMSALITCQTTLPVVRAATLAVSDVMEEIGMTELVLAARLGVSRQSVNCWFAGGIRTLKALAAVANALGCELHIELRKRVEAVAS